MATYTASSYLLQPKQVHVGNMTRHFVFSGQMLSIGDTILLAKVPHGATIIDCWARYGTPTSDGGAALSIHVTRGKSASQTSTLGVIGTISGSSAQVTFNMRNFVATAPFRISLSDDDAVQYGVLKARLQTAPASITGSGTMSLDGVVVWAMDAEA